MAHRIPPLRSGHRIELLEGSRQMFPAMVEAIDAARLEVRLETYIFDFLGESVEIAYALERAARRGVVVQVVVDGVGTPHVPGPWTHRLALAGVQWRVYSPLGPFGLLVRGQWRRLHRKLCLVDRSVAFCGGINILDDHYDVGGEQFDAPRLDFAIRVTGPLVADVEATMSQLWLRMEAADRLRHAQLTGALHSLRAASELPGTMLPRPARHSTMRAALVLRDNVLHRAQIERAYRRAIGQAREEIVIANAYFIPGGRMRRALAAAVRRGVRVILLVGGRYESFLQFYGARAVYGAMLRTGVEIHEYEASYLHGKVAVVDRSWSTVGSSNLDPLSLLLAREANVVVKNRHFAAQLRERLLRAVREEGHRLEIDEYHDRPWPVRAKEWLALALMRLALLVQGKEYL